MPMMDSENFPPVLEDAKTSGADWAEVAKATRGVLRSLGATVSMRSPAVAEVAERSGYSAAMLLRQQKLLSFIESQSVIGGVDPERYLQAGFTSLELVSLIHRHDPARTAELMEAVAEGQVTTEFLRGELSRVVSDKRRNDSEDSDVRAMERHDRRRQVMLGLQRDGFSRLLTRRPAWRGIRSEGPAEYGPVCRFTWWRYGARGAEGFDLLHLPTGTAASAVEDRIARSVMSAAYFSSFWIVLIEGSPFQLRILEALHWADDTRIGLMNATLTAEGRPAYIGVVLPAQPAASSKLAELFLRAVEIRNTETKT